MRMWTRLVCAMATPLSRSRHDDAVFGSATTVYGLATDPLLGGGDKDTWLKLWNERSNTRATPAIVVIGAALMVAGGTR